MKKSYDAIEPVIDPAAFVHERATVIGDVRIGPDVSVWPSAVLRGDQGTVEVGASSNIQDGVICHGTEGLSTTLLGRRVTVGHGAIVHGAHVGDDCLIGMGSILLDNAVIAPWTLVAAGALVPPGKAFPEGVLLVGNPARVARELTDADRESIEHGWREYQRLLERYRRPPPR